MGDAREYPFPDPNYNTPVKDLTYEDLLTNTFTQVSHDRGIKTWCVKETYPKCLFCGKKYHYELYNVECHMEPKIGKTNWEGKDCLSEYRITINILWSS